jgi:ParB-like chromosome segregation protein Spo0J
MEIQTIEITKLRPHPQNPRIHPDSAIEKLVKSLNEYGFTNPILISEDNYVLAGHARLKAAEKAGLKEVPVIQLPLKGSKALAYMIADNRLQDETDWDFTKLKDLLSELDTGALDMEITGFGIKEIENLLSGEAIEKPKHKKKCPKCGYEW